MAFSSPHPPWLTPLVFALALISCHHTHIPVASVPEIPYPSCGAAPLPVGEVLFSGHLRAGHTSLESNVQELFEIRRRDCLVIATVHQDWALQVSDVEVVYDTELRPLRAWRRNSLPGVSQPGGFQDTRKYEFRTPEPSLTRMDPAGRLTHEILRGGRPAVVLGPGRGLLTVWLQHAHLPVGGRDRELALDIREDLETLGPVALVRHTDQYVQALGRRVRVYTVYGRESFFADDRDVVVGDLAGTVPFGTPGLGPLPTLPVGSPPDPVNTP